MRHLLSIESLLRQDLLNLLETANKFVEVSQREIKKVPALRGKTVINLFLEPSTRTRASFEIAGKWLSADTINISGGESSVKKGESLLDTARNLQAMSPDILVVRHGASGAAQFLSRHLKNTSVVNAGDGLHEHPTQALLDCMTLAQHFKVPAEQLSGKQIAIVGDIRHSRVARSNLWAHLKLGNTVHLVGPPTLVPSELARIRGLEGSVKIFHDLERGLEGSDAVMVLRMQRERQQSNFISTIDEYCRYYCVNEGVLKRCCDNAVVMHPGPANRGIEISSEVLDGHRSLFQKQVANGVAVRMAVLFLLVTGKQREVLDATNS